MAEKPMEFHELRAGHSSPDSSITGRVVLVLPYPKAHELRLVVKDPKCVAGSRNIDIYLTERFVEHLKFLRGDDSIFVQGFEVVKRDDEAVVMVTERTTTSVSAWADDIKRITITPSKLDEPPADIEREARGGASKRSRSGKPAEAPRPNVYTYSPLSAAKVHAVLNVHAIVRDFKPANACKGTSLHMLLDIIDPSWSVASAGLKCSLFANNIKQLPAVLQAGDIVRLHGLRIQLYEGKLQGVFAKGHFSALAFSGQVGASFEPREPHTDGYAEVDRAKIVELRAWAAQRMALQAANSLSELREGASTTKLLCQVVQAFVPDAAAPYHRFLVWDGTRPTPAALAESVTAAPMLSAACAHRAVLVEAYDSYKTAAVVLMPGTFIRIVAECKALPGLPWLLRLHGSTPNALEIVAPDESSPDLDRLKRQIAEADQEHARSALAAPASVTGPAPTADAPDEQEDPTLEQLMQDFDSQAVQSAPLAGLAENADLDTQPGAKRARDEPLSAPITLDDEDELDGHEANANLAIAPAAVGAPPLGTALRLVIAPSPDLENDAVTGAAFARGDPTKSAAEPTGAQTERSLDTGRPVASADGALTVHTPEPQPAADGRLSLVVEQSMRTTEGDRTQAADTAVAMEVDVNVDEGAAQSQAAQSDAGLRLSLSPSIASDGCPSPPPQEADTESLLKAQHEASMLQTQLADYQPSSPMEEGDPAVDQPQLQQASPTHQAAPAAQVEGTSEPVPPQSPIEAYTPASPATPPPQARAVLAERTPPTPMVTELSPEHDAMTQQFPGEPPAPSPHAGADSVSVVEPAAIPAPAGDAAAALSVGEPLRPAPTSEAHLAPGTDARQAGQSTSPTAAAAAASPARESPDHASPTPASHPALATVASTQHSAPCEQPAERAAVKEELLSPAKCAEPVASAPSANPDTAEQRELHPALASVGDPSVASAKALASPACPSARLPLTSSAPVSHHSGPSSGPASGQQTNGSAGAEIAPRILWSTTLSPTAPASTLREVLSADVPRCFRSVVRVEAFRPGPTRLVQLVCQSCAVGVAAPFEHLDPACPTCGRARVPAYVIELLLRDSTAELRAIVCFEDAEMFLPGLPASDLARNEHTRELVATSIEALVKYNVWLDCCLMSYSHTTSKETMFRIFNTVLRIEQGLP